LVVDASESPGITLENDGDSIDRSVDRRPVEGFYIRDYLDMGNDAIPPRHYGPQKFGQLCPVGNGVRGIEKIAVRLPAD
jgi:hypothetical protein